MTQILSLLLFLGFVCLSLIAGSQKTERGRRRGVTSLVIYLLAVHVGLIALRRDAWPFVSRGVLMERGNASRTLSNLRFAAVDQFSREWEIDPISWSPIQDRTLQHWWFAHFYRLETQQQKSVLAFLLQKAESARRHFAAGERFGPARLLGVTSAPYWFTVARGTRISRAPYVRLRVYIVWRVPAEKARSGAETALLLAEYGP